MRAQPWAVCWRALARFGRMVLFGNLFWQSLWSACSRPDLRGIAAVFLRQLPLASIRSFCDAHGMLKKTLPFLLVTLLAAGCATQITNLTPHVQTRNQNNLYPVEVAFRSQQQNIRWDSVRPTVIVNNQPFEMHPTAMMTNRWEGYVPVPPGTDTVKYRYRVDFDVNGFGKRSAENAVSQDFTLKVRDPQP